MWSSVTSLTVFTHGHGEKEIFFLLKRKREGLTLFSLVFVFAYDKDFCNSLTTVMGYVNDRLQKHKSFSTILDDT
jgi:hypothetical protein